jgi:hypothetical protein
LSTFKRYRIDITVWASNRFASKFDCPKGIGPGM